jgi:starvation-inducible DNA-binding protein
MTKINEETVSRIASGMSSVLADSYMLYLQTQNFHWNVVGPRFHQLHELFESQYTEMAEAIDEIAERIRALGVRAPGTFKEFSKLSSIKEDDSITEADKMIEKLVEGHSLISNKSREVVQLAASGNDEATADLLTTRIKSHEKMNWMLKSLLQ